MNLREAEALANELLQRHGLAARGWRFVWDNRSTKRFGLCRYGRRTISLGRKLALLNPQEIKDTLLHEIGHALCPGSGHGREWKLMGAVLGYRPEACKSGSDVVLPPSRYEGYCKDCGIKFVRHRKPSVGTIRHARHTPCKFKTYLGHVNWFDSGKLLDQNGEIATQRYIELIGLPPVQPELQQAAKTVSSAKPELSQSEISAMWQRLEKLKGSF